MTEGIADGENMLQGGESQASSEPGVSTGLSGGGEPISDQQQTGGRARGNNSGRQSGASSKAGPNKGAGPAKKKAARNTRGSSSIAGPSTGSDDFMTLAMRTVGTGWNRKTAPAANRQRIAKAFDRVLQNYV